MTDDNRIESMNNTLQGETVTEAEARIRLLVAKHSTGLSVTEMDGALRAVSHILSGWRIRVKAAAATEALSVLR